MRPVKEMSFPLRGSVGRPLSAEMRDVALQYRCGRCGQGIKRGAFFHRTLNGVVRAYHKPCRDLELIGRKKAAHRRAYIRAKAVDRPDDRRRAK